MSQLVVLTPEDAAPGFALAGTLQQVTTLDEVETVLRSLIQNAEVNMIAIDERLLRDISPARLRLLERSWPGLVLILPAPAGRRGDGPDYIRQLLQHVLGYQVRLHR